VSALSTKTTNNDSAGIDTLDFSQATVGATVDLASSSAQKILAPANANTLTLKGTFENVVGTPKDDFIRGNSANNRLEGRGGNDTLYGGSGNDSLYGGDGDDWLYGEAGNDNLYGGAGNNVLLGGDGNDVLDVAAGVLTGSSGRNLLIGGKGADSLQGGSGQEILIGGTTTYDGRAAALAAIMQEWTSGQNDSFGNRCSKLDTGFADPKAGWIQLRRKDKTNPKGTVLDDGVRDALFGGPGSDWFLDFAKDEVHDP
jgi:Ca2+-binding RTX toxin-like protein